MSKQGIIVLAVVLFAATALAGKGTATLAMHGRVYDTWFGLPVAGATIIITGSGGLRKIVATDEEGAYGVEQLPAGAYKFAAEAPQYSVTRGQWEITVGQRDLPDIAMPQGYTWPHLPKEIQGEVRTSDMRPAANAQVVAVRPFGKEIVAETVTDNKGHYSMTVEYPSMYIVFCIQPGYKVATSVLTMGPEDQYKLDFVLTPFPHPR